MTLVVPQKKRCDPSVFTHGVMGQRRAWVLALGNWCVFVDDGLMNGVTYRVRIKSDNRTRKRKTHV